MGELARACHKRYEHDPDIRVEALIAKVEKFKKRHSKINLDINERSNPENIDAMREAHRLCKEVKLAIYQLYDDGPHIDAYRLLAAHEDMNRICNEGGENPEDYFTTHTEVVSQELEHPIHINGAVISVVTAVVSVLEVRTKPIDEDQTEEDIQKRRGLPVTMTYTIRLDFEKDQGRITWDSWQEDMTQEQMEHWITQSDTYVKGGTNRKVKNQVFSHGVRGNMNAAIAEESAENLMTEEGLWGTTNSHLTLVSEHVGKNKINPGSPPTLKPELAIMKDSLGNDIFEFERLARPEDVIQAIQKNKRAFGRKIEDVIEQGNRPAVKQLILPAMKNTL